ncbi:MAG: RagB/SusD family nutrient uptake outer membrane protein [Prevotellaceae bacterium]|nr:RagB/SusD family nutrient uptake outer membrane protein [Prevotellaceae bacterium]
MKYLSLILLCLCLSSCSKWLTLTPDDEIVSDEYWTDREDVEMAVASAYRYMIETDVLQRMVYFGEMRSDNLQSSSPNGNERAVLDEGNILSDNSICNWRSFYKVINICNTVIENAPIAKKSDSNYYEAELQHHLGEAIFLRALCYFYLIRAYGDVPYVTKASASDATDYNHPASGQDSIMKVLIDDVILAKDYAIASYSDKALNCGRVTKNACRALLADLYLTAENYTACINECNEILSNYNTLPGSVQKEWMLLPRKSFFSSVFYSGNSDESIFEFNLNSDNSANCSVFTQLYGNATSNPHLKPTTNVITIFDDADARGMQYINNTNSRVFKYVGQIAPIAETKADIASSTYTYRATNSASNWIIYRLADVYLMKAEALAVSGTKAEDFDEVVRLCNMTYIRSHPEGVDSLSHAQYTDNATAEQLVMLERRREFAFEGKRWFDLLRKVHRNGGPTDDVISDLVNNKYNGTMPDGISSKLTSMGYWYWPIYIDEIKVNKQLHQNSYYAQQESSY